MLAFLTIQRISLNMQLISTNQSIHELLTFVFTLLRRSWGHRRSIRGSAAGGVAGAQTKHHQNSSIEMKQVRVENLF